ncbi:hypothetical protein [Mesorhizobium sp. ES1-1]|uniref:hypothetical protein n=1 Tax=Mesorhizobium sp. ES1-1 TaxID=2876629 RepID=UPI001CCFA3E6|nr:hypothetical protein [Mesorhizobium sp. ES1-1]MBZ9676864.1 hypothetical protein [Mesorhizobium sp. ES1-1]
MLSNMGGGHSQVYPRALCERVVDQIKAEAQIVGTRIDEATLATIVLSLCKNLKTPFEENLLILARVRRPEYTRL